MTLEVEISGVKVYVSGDLVNVKYTSKSTDTEVFDTVQELYP